MPENLPAFTPASMPNPPYQNLRKAPGVTEKRLRYSTPPFWQPPINLGPPLPSAPQLHARPVAYNLKAPLPYVTPPPFEDPTNTPHPLQRYYRPPKPFPQGDNVDFVSSLKPDQITPPPPTTRPDRNWHAYNPILSSSIDSKQTYAPFPTYPLSFNN